MRPFETLAQHPTLLAVVGRCWSKCSNGPNKCQQCWTYCGRGFCRHKLSQPQTCFSCCLSAILNQVPQHVRECNIRIVSDPLNRAQHSWATLRRSQDERNVVTCWFRSLKPFKPRPTTSNRVFKRSQHVKPEIVVYLLFAKNVVSVCTGVSSTKETDVEVQAL